MQAATVATTGVYVCRAINRRTPAEQGIVSVTVSPLPITTAARATTEPLTTTMATTEEVSKLHDVTHDLNVAIYYNNDNVMYF